MGTVAVELFDSQTVFFIGLAKINELTAQFIDNFFRHRRIDLGRLIYRDHAGRALSRYFHNVVSFGLGGEVDARVNRSTKACGGFVSFVWATLVSLVRYQRKCIHLRVDDHFDREVRVWNVAVANGGYHGGGMHVAPGADPEDGLFQVTVIGDLSLAQVVANLPRLYNGRIYGHEKIWRVTGKRITASAAQPVLLDMDGEQPGRLPVIIEMVPAALSLICNG